MSRVLLLILLYITLGGAWAWRLRPQPVAPVDEQRLPRIERLSQYLSKAPPETVRPILMSIAFLADDKLALADLWLKKQPLQQLRELTVQDTPLLHNSGNFRDALLLGWLGQDSVAHTANEAHLMIAAAGVRFDNTMRLYAFEKLAARARAEGDLESAMTILERAADIPGTGWAVTHSYIQIARERDLPVAALSGINDWLKRTTDKTPAADLDEARELQVFFLMRLNRAEDALHIQLDRLKALPEDAPLPEPTLSRALVTARASGHLTQVMPWIQRHLSSYAEHAMKPEALLTHTDMDPGYVHWLREYAALADHELPPALAYEACLRLVSAGEVGALARTCQLATEAKLTPEALPLLRSLLALPTFQPTVLSVAQTDPLARRVVTESLREKPADRDLHFAAVLAEAAHAPGSAATLWHSYLRRFPDDSAARRRLVQAHLTARQPALALRVLEGISPEALTDADRHQKELLQQL